MNILEKIDGKPEGDIKTKDVYLRLRGLPYTVKEADIHQFFEGLNVTEVQLTSMPDGRSSGEAFVGFATAEDASQGILRDKNKVGPRYVEVFRVTEPEFARIKNVGVYPGGLPPQPLSHTPVAYPLRNVVANPLLGGAGVGGAVRIRGLPYSCKQAEISAFFQGLNVEEVVFGKEPGEGGRPTGEGYVRFSTQEEADAAMQYNGQHLGKRYLELFMVDLDQFERYKRQQTSGAQPLNSFNCDWNQWYGGPGTEDYYGWDPYAAAPPHHPRGRGGGFRGAYQGHGYKDYSTGRPSPYDYHGRVYGGEMAGYGGGYEGFAYPGHGYAVDPSTGTKVHMRGLPFRVNASQIIDFFNPLQCVEIKMGYLPDGRASGDGIVEFSSPEEVKEALKKDRQMIGNRYIEVFGPSAMKVAPGTTYKKIGGTGRPTVVTVQQPPAAAGYEAPYEYQW